MDTGGYGHPRGDRPGPAYWASGHDLLALYLWLAAVTGARRGELCVLHWADLDLERGVIRIAHSYSVAGGAKVRKDTKTHQDRSVMTGINSSYPKNNRTWVVDANNFSGATTTFNVYAVCAKQPAGYVQLESSPIDNSAGQQTSATMGCGTGDVILGGGAISGFNITSVVMTSSYPNSSASWTAAVSNFSDGGSVFGVLAICASASALLNYAIPSTSASDPAGTQKGIIQACTAPAVVLGGGNQSSNTTNLRISIKTTQPFPTSGASWKSGENNDTSFGTTLTSYAICAT